MHARNNVSRDPASLALARERLAQLHEARGDTARALENFRAFADLWKNAEPALQPAVRTAQERIRRLSTSDRPRRGG